MSIAALEKLVRHDKAIANLLEDLAEEILDRVLTIGELKDELSEQKSRERSLIEALAKIREMPPKLTTDQLIEQSIDIRLIASNAVGFSEQVQS
jgi:hypothetical protein